MMTFNQISQSAGYKGDDVSVSLTVCGGSYGGGSEVLVVAYGLDSFNQEIAEETSTTLRTNGGGDSMPKVLVIDVETESRDDATSERND